MGFNEDYEQNSPLKRDASSNGRIPKSKGVFKVIKFQQDQPANFRVSRKPIEKKRKVIPKCTLILISLCLLFVLVFGIGDWIFMQRSWKTLDDILQKLENSSHEDKYFSMEGMNHTGDELPEALAVIKSVKFSSTSTGFLTVPLRNGSGNSTRSKLSTAGLQTVAEKKPPLTLLMELVQRGARFTCDTTCEEPRVIKTILRVNSEAHSWEGSGNDIDNAKQEAAFRALKELYPPHILAEVIYEPRNSTFECILFPDLNMTSSTTKPAKKC